MRCKSILGCASTLQTTIENVLNRVTTNQPVTLVSGDAPAVPKLYFDLTGDFPVLEGLVLRPSPTARVKNLKTESVKQLLRFQLNEKGAILKSGAEMDMLASAVVVDLRAAWARAR